MDFVRWLVNRFLEVMRNNIPGRPQMLTSVEVTIIGELTSPTALIRVHQTATRTSIFDQADL